MATATCDQRFYLWGWPDAKVILNGLHKRSKASLSKAQKWLRRKIVGSGLARHAKYAVQEVNAKPSS